MTPESTKCERLLRIQEVSELTGLSVGTLYHFVSAKKIPVVRLSRRCIRFRLSDLQVWLEDLTQGSVEVNGKRLSNSKCRREQV
jgi:excisionase family DNA binding protein